MVPDVHIRPARNSALSKIPVRIALVDYRMIGRFEHVRPDRFFTTLHGMLRRGYDSPAISVFEQHEDAIYSTLPDTAPTQVAVTKYGQVGVADGHHRLAAITLLDRLGVLRSPIIPVQILPAREPEIVKTTTMETGDQPLRPGEAQLTLAEIEACFPDPDVFIPPNLTVHFEVRFQDGTFDRVRQGQPDVNVFREDFLGGKYNLNAIAQHIENDEFQSDAGQEQILSDRALDEIVHEIRQNLES